MNNGKIYEVTLAAQNGLIVFEAAWSQARIYGTEEWKSLDDFDFPEMVTNYVIPAIQFKTTVVWTSDDNGDGEGEEWKNSSGDTTETERPAIYTIKTKYISSVRIIYENEEDQSR